MYNQKMWKKVKKKFFGEKEPAVDYLVVGLGNPGEKYQKTAHNSGFRVVSFFREENSIPQFTKDNPLNSYFTKGVVDDVKVALLLPLSFMNLSGSPVKKALKRLSLVPERLIVVHDDTDLEMGTVRFSLKRGSAGHRGVNSIIKTVGSNDFARVRVGVGKNENQSAREVVLKNVPPKMEEVEKMASKELKEAIVSEITAKTLQI